MTDREMENRSFQKRRIITHGDDVVGINTHTPVSQGLLYLTDWSDVSYLALLTCKQMAGIASSSVNTLTCLSSFS